jgi:curved DNA-binding protein CbpA
MNQSECLKIFNLHSDYSKKDLKHAYQKLSKKYHPDIAGEQGRKMFIKINDAYKILSDKWSKTAKAMQTQSSDSNELRSSSSKKFEIKKNENFDTVSKEHFNEYFNSMFLKNASSSKDDIYNIDHSKEKNRSRSEFEKEYNNVNNIISQQKPILGSYNSQDFNSCFESIKKQTSEIEIYKNPEPRDDNKDYFDSVENINMGMYVTPQSAPNYNRMDFIRQESTMSHNAIQKRLNEREQAIINIKHTNEGSSLYAEDKKLFKQQTAINYEQLQKEKEILIRKLRNPASQQEKDQILNDLMIITTAEKKFINEL